ncbi:MAG: hypothetical protein DRQ02_09250, partial [Candidatus Latescibacterota bacterium]
SGNSSMGEQNLAELQWGLLAKFLKPPSTDRLPRAQFISFFLHDSRKHQYPHLWLILKVADNCPFRQRPKEPRPAPASSEAYGRSS